MPVKIKIETWVIHNEFRLTLFISTDEMEETIFRFSNDSKSFQRDRIVIETASAAVLDPVALMYIQPIAGHVIETSISNAKVFNYEIRGKIEDSGDAIFLDLDTAGYMLKKNEQYSIYVKFKGQKSNKENLYFTGK